MHHITLPDSICLALIVFMFIRFWAKFDTAIKIAYIAKTKTLKMQRMIQRESIC